MHNKHFRACLSVRHTFAGLVLQMGGPGRRGGGGNPLSPNSSETAWNFQTPFYRIEAGRLRMVYVNFHKPICPRDFSITIYYFYWEVASNKQLVNQ